MKNVHRIVKEHQEKQKHASYAFASRFRSFSFPPIEEKTPDATRRILSCGDDAIETVNAFDLEGVKTKAEQENENASSYRDTRL